MKRFLSIVLTLALIVPAISAEAASTGYFEGGASTVMNREFSQDFESAAPIAYYNASTGKDSTSITDGGTTPKIYWTNQNDERQPTDASKFVWNAFTYDTADALFKAPGSTKYLTVRTTVAKKAAGATDQIIGPWLTFKNMQDGEKGHMSFYIKNDDFIYDKEVFQAKSNRSGVAMSFVRMGKDGMMTFGYASSPSVSVGYSLNRWYKIDLVFTHNDSSNDTVDMYLDGKLMVTNEYASLMDSNSALTFKIVSKNVDYDGTSDSVLCVDDITAKMYAAEATLPTIIQNKFAYLGFEGVKSAASGADGFLGSGSTANYALVTGKYGKESADTSAKVSGASINAYELDVTNIKQDTALASDGQLKLSASYAYSTGDGIDSLKLTGQGSGISLFEIDRTTGVLTGNGSAESVTLSSEKWYNLDTIITAKSDSTLDYTIYVNGISSVTGSINDASLQGASGAEISRLSLVMGGASGESYLDDMYAEYFAPGTEAIVNAPIVNAEVDLTTNGKMVVPAGYTIADILADTTDTVKVIANVEGTNQSVTSGMADGALITVGTLCPVYAYGASKYIMTAPTATFDTVNSEVTVSESLTNNDTASMPLTLVTAVYKDGKYHSMAADSKICLNSPAPQPTTLSTVDTPIPSDASVKIFTTNGWADKTPAFSAYTASAIAGVTEVSTATAPAADASTTFEVDPFDYTAVSVTMSGTIGTGGAKSAGIYIVPKDADITALSDGNLPVFADTITTDTDGRFRLSVSFIPDHIDSSASFGYGEYDVYVVSKDLAQAYKADFEYYSPADLLAHKMQAIYDAALAAPSWDVLMGVILGYDLTAETIAPPAVNDNFTTIAPDTTNYTTLVANGKGDAVFVQMFNDKANLVAPASLKSEFERISLGLANGSIADPTVVTPPAGTVTPSAPSGTTGNSTPVMNVSPGPGAGTGTGGAAVGGAAMGSVFKDTAGHWAESYVNALYQKGVINGYPDGSFGPENTVTRAELIKIISVAFGINGSSNGSFGDVPADSWFAPYVNGAANAGIVTGFGGNFNPNAPVTRQDAAVMLHRAIERTHDLGIGYVFFADETSISPYAAEQVSALAEIGIITGNGENQFKPLSSLSRAEAAALISRAADYILAH